MSDFANSLCFFDTLKFRLSPVTGTAHEQYPSLDFARAVQPDLRARAIPPQRVVEGFPPGQIF